VVALLLDPLADAMSIIKNAESVGKSIITGFKLIGRTESDG
jgi:ribosomal protein S8